MKKTPIVLAALIVCFVMLAVHADEQTMSSKHVLVQANSISWGDAPPVFRKGAKFAVISGDPSKEGLFVVRLKVPAGYYIAPHWHPTDEHVTVLSGTFALGMGDTMDKSKAKSVPAGGYALLPAHMNHYALAKTASTIEVFGMGPFALTYVNPADDPSKSSK